MTLEDLLKAAVELAHDTIDSSAMLTGPQHVKLIEEYSNDDEMTARLAHTILGEACDEVGETYDQED